MNSILDYIPRMPLDSWVETAIDWLIENFAFLFNAVQNGGETFMNVVTNILLLIPPLTFIVLMVFLAFFISGKKYTLPTFVGLGLIYIYNQGLWTDLMNTFTLVATASLISILIGIPLGIWMSKSSTAKKVIQPLLDFMQTMPAFVYLIPAVAFFGIGMVPGVFAAVIFSIPPVVRLTSLGIQQVPEELVEAADSFGSTASQKLFKVELPMAKSNIMAGINQTILLALSMVVIGSMIGAPGLGTNVLTALQRAQIGQGFVSGIAIVILAIILDRLMEQANQDTTK